MYKIKDKDTGNILSAKISIKSTEEESKDAIINIIKEVSIISKLGHRSFLKFIGYSPINLKKKPMPVIVTEYAPNGTLCDLLKIRYYNLNIFQMSQDRNNCNYTNLDQ